MANRHGLRPEAIDDLIDTLAILAELLEPEAVVENELTDHADLPLLGSLLAALRLGLAQTLVTGDKALLALRDRYPIRTSAEFWAEHGRIERLTPQPLPSAKT